MQSNYELLVATLSGKSAKAPEVVLADAQRSSVAAVARGLQLAGMHFGSHDFAEVCKNDGDKEVPREDAGVVRSNLLCGCGLALGVHRAPDGSVVASGTFLYATRNHVVLAPGVVQQKWEALANGGPQADAVYSGLRMLWQQQQPPVADPPAKRAKRADTPAAVSPPADPEQQAAFDAGAAKCVPPSSPPELVPEPLPAAEPAEQQIEESRASKLAKERAEGDAAAVREGPALIAAQQQKIRDLEEDKNMLEESQKADAAAYAAALAAASAAAERKLRIKDVELSRARAPEAALLKERDELLKERGELLKERDELLVERGEERGELRAAVAALAALSERHARRAAGKETRV